MSQRNKRYYKIKPGVLLRLTYPHYPWDKDTIWLVKRVNPVGHMAVLTVTRLDTGEERALFRHRFTRV